MVKIHEIINKSQLKFVTKDLIIKKIGLCVIWIQVLFRKTHQTQHSLYVTLIQFLSKIEFTSSKYLMNVSKIQGL